MFDVELGFFIPDGSQTLKPAGAFELLRPWAGWLARKDASLLHWYMGGDSREEAMRYQAFVDSDLDGHAACVALVEAEKKKEKADDFLVLVWNGCDSSEGASIALMVWQGPNPAQASMKFGDRRGTSRIGAYTDVAELLAMMVRDTKAVYGFVYNQAGYGSMQIFKDRPGVGWMLYLPRVLTVQQVPEARALLPVMEGKAQLGTIIVSVTDAVFDDKNKEHVAVSHAIETRLVDQDLLPRYADL